MKKSLWTALAAVVAALAVAAVAAAATIVVSPGNLNGWTLNNDTCGAATTGSISFVSGPATPPLGTGSVKLTVGANGDSYPTLRYGGYNGVALANVTAFSYSTYVTQFGTGGQAPYIDLKIDYTGDGSADDTLTFEPIYQTAQPVALNTWQTWNALAGRWWSDNSGGPPPFYTIPQYLAAHPTAKIVNTATGGVRLAAGCGGAAWTNFVGYADNLTIGVSASNNTFNFEPTSGGPGPGPNHKVTICHKGHTIKVDAHALRAHLKHGDHLGPC
jgi:hypothetical protein